MKKTEEIQNLCRVSLKFLCEKILGYKDWDLIHDDIETFLANGKPRKLVLVPRGHLKTAIVTKAYSIQTLLKNPNARILIANQVWDKAREMLYEIKEYLTTKSILPQLFGEFQSNRWTSDDIVIRQRTQALSSASIATTGVEAETTSSHYDLIIADDLQGLQNSQTPEQRHKVIRFYQSLTDLLEPTGKEICVGTRWHFDDLYQHIIDNETDYFDITVRKVIEDGRIIFPKKFNLDYIDYLKRNKGADFYAQYMNSPIDEENQLFKRGYFWYWDRRPENLYIGLTVDLAISQKQEADYTAIVAAAKDANHNIYVLDYLRGKWSPAAIVDKIFEMRSKWRPHVCGIESNGFQKTLVYSLEEEMRKRRDHFPITEIKNTNLSKEFRIKALEPYYRNNLDKSAQTGHIYHAAWMKEKELEAELTAFPKAKNDDISDALSMQLNLLSPGTAKMPEKVQPGTWEHWRRHAEFYNQPYQGFFNNGL